MDKFVTHSRKRPEGASGGACHSKKSREEPEEELAGGHGEEEDDSSLLEEFAHPLPWRKIEAEGLDCDYCQLFETEEANELFNALEKEVEYFTGELQPRITEIVHPSQEKVLTNSSIVQ